MMRTTRVKSAQVEQADLCAVNHGIAVQQTEQIGLWTEYTFTTESARKAFEAYARESGISLYADRSPVSVTDMIEDVASGTDPHTAIDEALTVGIKRAIMRMQPRYVCSDASCGFCCPPYPGAYPSRCPECGSPLNDPNAPLANDPVNPLGGSE